MAESESDNKSTKYENQYNFNNNFNNNGNNNVPTSVRCAPGQVNPFLKVYNISSDDLQTNIKE